MQSDACDTIKYLVEDKIVCNRFSDFITPKKQMIDKQLKKSHVCPYTSLSNIVTIFLAENTNVYIKYVDPVLWSFSKDTTNVRNHQTALDTLVKTSNYTHDFKFDEIYDKTDVKPLQLVNIVDAPNIWGTMASIYSSADKLPGI